MNEALSLLAQVREHYLSKYRGVLVEYLKKHNPSSPEVLFELPHPERAYPFRLYRTDMASNVNGQPSITEVNPSTHLHFEPLQDRTDRGLNLQLHPMVWNGVEFDCAGKSADAAPLETWCLRWLDVDEVGPKDETGLLGAIHSVTEPESGNGRFSFSVDFGSAPIEAVHELFDALATIGISDAKLSSSFLGET